MRGTYGREQIQLNFGKWLTQGNKISSKKCKTLIQNISFPVHKGLLIVFRTPRSISCTDLQAMLKVVQKAFSHKNFNLIQPNLNPMVPLNSLTGSTSFRRTKN